MVKLWHDDVRPAPEGWVWARTNEQAKDVLQTADVVEVSLDHDLGWHEIDEADMDADTILRGIPPRFGHETGLHLVDWMIENGHVPARVTIHSWNPAGAQHMRARLNRAGYDCVVAPFQVRG